MKINAKKTNSASENAIQCSYFGLEFGKLIHCPRLDKRNSWLADWLSNEWMELSFSVWGLLFQPVRDARGIPE